jgi:FkbM family methyltransferase
LGNLGQRFINLRQLARREWAAQRLRSLIDVHQPEVTKLGSDRGGWTIPASIVKPGATAVCVGVGEDISFDVELNKKGLKVYTVDPTPRSKEHVEQVLDAVSHGRPMPIERSPKHFYDLQGFERSRFSYLDVGLWEKNTTMRFYAPKHHEHVSHSIVNLQHTEGGGFDARCVTLQSLCDSHKIGEIDLLKMDVEGAEYAILKNIVESGPRPKVICFEFDELRSPLDSGYMGRIRATVKMLQSSGYKFRHMEASNALFVQ